MEAPQNNKVINVLLFNFFLSWFIDQGPVSQNFRLEFAESISNFRVFLWLSVENVDPTE